MRVIINIEGTKDDIKTVLQILRDDMDYAEPTDTFRLYMENDQPGGNIIEERYDENDQLLSRRVL